MTQKIDQVNFLDDTTLGLGLSYEPVNKKAKQKKKKKRNLVQVGCLAKVKVAKVLVLLLDKIFAVGINVHSAVAGARRLCVVFVRHGRLLWLRTRTLSCNDHLLII